MVGAIRFGFVEHLPRDLYRLLLGHGVQTAFLNKSTRCGLRKVAPCGVR